MGLPRRVLSRWVLSKWDLSRWACQDGPVDSEQLDHARAWVEVEPQLKSDRSLPLRTRNTAMRRVKKSTDVHSIYDISECWKCARAWLRRRDSPKSTAIISGRPKVTMVDFNKPPDERQQFNCLLDWCPFGAACGLGKCIFVTACQGYQGSPRP